MSLDDKYLELSAPYAAQSLASTAVVAQMISIPGMAVTRVKFLIGTATVSSGNIIVKFNKRPTLNSATNESLIAQLSIPGGVAAGTVYYKNVASAIKLLPGEVISVEVTTAAAGGGAAGAGMAMVEGYRSYESPVNQPTTMVASA